jgi:hypothetical protein
MIRVEHNVTTGEILEIELTPKEIEERQAQAALVAAEKAEAQAKRQTALAKLAGLGLEQDDLKALGL